MLYDLPEAIANATQVMTFSAYGQMLAVHAVAGGAVATQAASLTSLGYSGEHFDAKAAQQYLRARFYSPATGTFNRLDPFSGNMQDPQSLHKYLYVHGDPVQGVDPSGRFVFGGVIGLLGGFAIGKYLRGRDATVSVGVFTKIVSWLPVGAGYFLFAKPWAKYLLEPEWVVSEQIPGHDDDLPIADWIRNVEQVLTEHVEDLFDNGTITADQRNIGISGAQKIAQIYVHLVRSRARSEAKLVVNENREDLFGSGGLRGWGGNRKNSELRCDQWVSHLQGSMSTESTGWVARFHNGKIRAGDISMFYWRHAFTSLTFEPNSIGNEFGASLKKVDAPDFILDPWATARPHIYLPDYFLKIWPLEMWPDNPYD